MRKRRKSKYKYAMWQTTLQQIIEFNYTGRYNKYIIFRIKESNLEININGTLRTSRTIDL